MNLQQLLNSKQSGRIALQLARILPIKPGLWLSDLLASQIARRTELPLVQGIRANQWVVGGESLSSQELNLTVRETLQHIARAMFLLFHHLHRPDSFWKFIVPCPAILDELLDDQRRKKGVIIAGVHLAYYDVFAQTALPRSQKILALATPQSNPAIEWQHQLRRRIGVEILPTSYEAIREAIRIIQNGGIVIAGIDYPLRESKYQSLFFNHPAYLPVHHIYLALKTKAPILLVAAIAQADGLVKFLASDYIELRSFPDHQREILYNTELILRIAEDFIHQAPHQWAMFHPVWPDLLNNVPGMNGASNV